MIITGGRVGAPSNISFSDGDEVTSIHGKSAELVVTSLHDTLYTQTYRGNMFHGVSTTAAAIPISNTTAPNFILYNPRSSNVNCLLIGYCAGYASGSQAAGNIMFGVITDAPAAPATGAAISAFTNSTILNGYLGRGNASKVRFGVTATIVAATQFLPLGITLLQFIASSDFMFQCYHDFRGTVIVPPGVAIFSCMNAASVALYNERLIWYEFPT